MWETCSCRQLLQLHVLRLCCFEDGDVRIGISPEREELLVGGKRPSTGSIGIRCLCLFLPDREHGAGLTNLENLSCKKLPPISSSGVDSVPNAHPFETGEERL